MFLHIRRRAAVTAACALTLGALGLAGCRGPTVGIVPPTEPITLNINITVQQDVRVRLEEDVATLLDREDGVSTRAAAPGEIEALGGELARSEPEIEGFKAKGQVGERYDGLLGVVAQDAPSDLHALVASVNDARRAAYADIASRHVAPIADVQALAAKTRIEGAARGEYVMLEPGVWRKV